MQETHPHRPAAPAPSQNEPAGVGHNAPPTGIDAIIANMQAGLSVTKALAEFEHAAFAPDQKHPTNTPEGREAIAAQVRAVVKSKTKAENAGKALVQDWKAKSSVVDAKRKEIRDKLEAIRDKIRAPLEKWEAVDSRRKELLCNRLKVLETAFEMESTSALGDLKDALVIVRETPIDNTWEEYESEAKHKKENAFKSLTENIKLAETREAEKAELEAFRQKARLAEDEAEKQRKAIAAEAEMAAKKTDPDPVDLSEPEEDIFLENKPSGQGRILAATDLRDIATPPEKPIVSGNAIVSAAMKAAQVTDNEIERAIISDLILCTGLKENAQTDVFFVVRKITEALLANRIEFVKVETK